jgi:hypothetical protein
MTRILDENGRPMFNLRGKERAAKLREVQVEMERVVRGAIRQGSTSLSITEAYALMVRAVENVTQKDAERARREGEALAEEYSDGWWTGRYSDKPA